MDRLTPERQRLVEENHNLIYFVLRKNGWSVDKYYGTAAIGLCKAGLLFQEDYGTKFTTYAVRAIYNEVLQEIRKDKTQKRSMCAECRFDDQVEYPGSWEYEPESLIIFEEEQREHKTKRI